MLLAFVENAIQHLMKYTSLCHLKTVTCILKIVLLTKKKKTLNLNSSVCPIYRIYRLSTGWLAWPLLVDAVTTHGHAT